MLIELDKDFVSNLPIELYDKWAPIVVSYPISYGLDNDDYFPQIVKLFYEKVSNKMLKLLKKKIDFEAEKDERIWITAKFECCWDDNISKILYEKLIESKLPINCYKSILEDLVKHNYKSAISFSVDKLTSPVPEDELEYKKLLFTCSLLLKYSSESMWKKLWKLIQENQTFGKELFLNIAYGHSDNGDFIKNIAAKELGEVYIWLERMFPDKDFKESEGVYPVSPREEIKYFKNNIIKELEQKGSIEAKLAINKIKLNFPEFDWLNYVLYRSSIITRQKNWKPLRPKELLEILNDKNLRSIKNEEDLINIIFESLNKLEIKMHGTTPTVEYVWNSKPCTPNTESHLSNFIKNHLQDDLKKTVVNREVEIRPTRGKSKGENTDLLVQAFSEDRMEIISVIIEVKGSWNKELKNDMENQLKNRYLMDNQCKFGIYLVGWFLCDSWDKKEDYRYVDNLKINIEEATRYFQNQARKLRDETYRLYSKVLDCRLK
jgi:hypothetical protein